MSTCTHTWTLTHTLLTHIQLSGGMYCDLNVTKEMVGQSCDFQWGSQEKPHPADSWVRDTLKAEGSRGTTERGGQNQGLLKTLGGGFGGQRVRPEHHQGQRPEVVVVTGFLSLKALWRLQSRGMMGTCSKK